MSDPLLDVLPNDAVTALLDGLLRSEYHLLAGAGASVGAIGGDGRPIPNAEGLAKEIAEDFSLATDGERVDLAQAYELVEGLSDNQGRDRASYLKRRFSRCTPTWQHALTPIRWRRIWNLNIDDVVEQAYTQGSCTAAQAPQSYNWTAPYRESAPDRDEVQIVHLHGYALELEAPESGDSSVVFSILEYLQATSSRHAWHRVFGDSFLQSPFIVVGAKLTDEYDLAEYLRRGNQSQTFTGRPSIIVLENISPIQRQQFHKWGLLSIQLQAEEFFSCLAHKVAEAERRQAATVIGQPRELLPRQARIFIQQFKALRGQTTPLEPPHHDLYAGEDPVWADIVYNRDARFEIVDRLLASTVAPSGTPRPKPRQAVHCIWGPRFTGKSTALLRIGQELISAGFDVFLFRGEERLHVQATHWWVDQSPKSVLLFDGAADFSNDIADLCELSSSTDSNLLIFAVERERRLVELQGSILPQFLQAGEDHKMLYLSDNDIQRLLAKLRQERRLGKLTALDKAAQTRYFRREAGRHLFAGMAELEKAKGFATRITKEYQDIPDELARATYALTCMSYTIGYPLPAGIASAAVGISSPALISALDQTGQLADVLHADSKGFRPRHRVIASLVVHNALARRQRYDLSLALAKALAPHVTPDAIRYSTLCYRIVRRLMDEDLVFDWVGSQSVSDWYAGLRSHYEWNARFWEQRALAEARLEHFPRSRSFAEAAVRIHRDVFTLNTLGTILLRMAVQYYQPGHAPSPEFLWNGIANLDASRELAKGRFPHPFTAFFTYVLRFAEEAFQGQPVDARLAAEWQRWMNDARYVRAFASPTAFAQLHTWHTKWLHLAVDKEAKDQG